MPDWQMVMQRSHSLHVDLLKVRVISIFPLNDLEIRLYLLLRFEKYRCDQFDQETVNYTHYDRRYHHHGEQ